MLRSVCHRCLLRAVSLAERPSSGHGGLTAAGLGKMTWLRTVHYRRLSSSRIHNGQQTATSDRDRSTLNQTEVDKFSALAQLWWDQAGVFAALHAYNELRVPLIRDALVLDKKQNGREVNAAKPLEGCRILDVGSGGGLLSEPLARLGARVTGAEASEENVAVARVHAALDDEIASNITYLQKTIEEIPEEMGGFDGLVASEVVEHVNNVPHFVAKCSQLVRPGGSLFFTTINRTWLSYALAIVMAERVLKAVPYGTHDWDKFVLPEDLKFMLEKNGCVTRLLHGTMLNPVTTRWSWWPDTSVSYALHAVKVSPPPESRDNAKTTE